MAGEEAVADAVKVSVATQVMTARVNDAGPLPAVEQAVAAIGYGLTPLERVEARPAGRHFSRNDALGQPRWSSRPA
nr:hypothetical protein [Roseisolibacter agri]